MTTSNDDGPKINPFEVTAYEAPRWIDPSTPFAVDDAALNAMAAGQGHGATVTARHKADGTRTAMPWSPSHPGYKPASPNQPEPAPNALPAAPAIWDLVVADMKERDVMGAAKYGVRLKAGDGRDSLVDAYQEALDLAVYLRKAIEERKTGR